MSVVPFRPRADRTAVHAAAYLPVAAPATGSFRSPTACAGSFVGSYRLERFVWQFGQLAAVGVFTGKLVDADGSRIGIGSRRNTAAVEVDNVRGDVVAHLGPLDVNLLGFIVAVDELSLVLGGEPAFPLAARELVEPHRRRH